jgi:hypothetical protein
MMPCEASSPFTSANEKIMVILSICMKMTIFPKEAYSKDGVGLYFRAGYLKNVCG